MIDFVAEFHLDHLNRGIGTRFLNKLNDNEIDL